MKLKKLLAAVTAAALAVTTMAVTSFTASAAAFTPYILLNVNSNTWGINGSWVAADKTEIIAGKTEYEFTYTASKDDTWNGDDAKIEAYCYSPMDNLKNMSIKSVSINDADKNISVNAGSYNPYLWDNIESGSVPGYSMQVDAATVKALGDVSSGDVFKIVVTATLDENVKSIGSANFTCSKTATTELAVGDSFTITYDDTNTPPTAKWVVKCAFGEDFADSGISNRWPQLVNADGSVDNSAAEDTGLSVEKASNNVYTFTATSASKAEFSINVEASAAGDFSDTQYLGQGGGSWKVVDNGGTTPPESETVNLRFPTDAIELTVEENEWDGQDPHGLMAKADFETTDSPIIGKTFDELGNTTLKLTGVKFDNCSIESVQASDVKITLYTQWGSGWTWKPAAEVSLDNTNFTFDLSTIEGVDGADELKKYGFQITIGDGSKFDGLAAGDTVKINYNNGGDDPTPPVTGSALWEGNTDMGTDWSANVQIPAAKFAEIKVGDTLKYTFTCESGAQMKIASLTEGWPVIPGPNPDPEWGVININGTSFSFVLTADDVTALKEYGMAVSGQKYTLTKVELVPKSEPKPPVDPDHTHTPSAAWTSDKTGHWHACSGCDEKVDFAAHTSDGGTITTPATETTAGVKTYKCTVCNYVIKTEPIPATGTGSSINPWAPPSYIGAPVIPFGGVTNTGAPSIGGKSGWEVISAEITTASDGDKIVVDMNGAEKIPSTILGDVEGKDVDVVFNMGSGIKWTINGLSVTSNKTINFDVTKNTRHIPDEIVDKAEGSHKKQISLDHKGSFGCVATLSYDIGTKYNGRYANLFYYNPKTGELEFADCSLISGGNAKFTFTHASDYLITISDEPLGEFEDVSSASGIVSDNNSIGNGIAVSAVLAAVVLGFGVVVYKKRRHN